MERKEVPMGEDVKSPNVLKMESLLGECQREGYDGVRLFIPNNRDISLDDIAHDFCALEMARRNGTCVERMAANF